jgi:hypothetical protein
MGSKGLELINQQSILFYFGPQMKESHISWKLLMVNGLTNLVEFLIEVDMVLALYLFCLMNSYVTIGEKSN